MKSDRPVLCSILDFDRAVSLEYGRAGLDVHVEDRFFI
jgi:hypothetical protein